MTSPSPGEDARAPGEDAGEGADSTFDELLRFVFPLRLVSNAREHWRTHARRVKAEREALHWEWLASKGRPLKDGEVADVLLIRVAPRPFDAHENLPHAFKGLVDQIAAELGLAKKDNSQRLNWRYEQRRGAVREHAVAIHVRYSLAAPACAAKR